MVLVKLFLFNGTASTEIYTLSLHDALPICARRARGLSPRGMTRARDDGGGRPARRKSAVCTARSKPGDRKSTRLNSSHPSISYAVFCLKKKTQTTVKLQALALLCL